MWIRDFPSTILDNSLRSIHENVFWFFEKSLKYSKAKTQFLKKLEKMPFRIFIEIYHPYYINLKSRPIKSLYYIVTNKAGNTW